MLFRHAVTPLLVGSLIGSPLLVGCENLPGVVMTQGAVIWRACRRGVRRDHRRKG